MRRFRDNAEPEAPDDQVARLRHSIADSRRRIDESLDRLRVEMDEALDWREWVQEHPWESVGVAFAVGFYLGFR